LLSISNYCFRAIELEVYWGHDLTFRVTWRHRSCDQSNRHRPFPIGGPLEPSLYF